MSKMPAKTPATADADDETDQPATPKKRSKLVLAALATVSLALAGGGGWYGWAVYSGGDTHASAGHDGTDPIQVAALPTEILAESSFTHSFALSVMIAEKCGVVPAPALSRATEDEAHADGMLVNLSWVAAARRTGLLDAKNCTRLKTEIRKANAKAEGLAMAKAGGTGGHGDVAH